MSTPQTQSNKSINEMTDGELTENIASLKESILTSAPPKRTIGFEYQQWRIEYKSLRLKYRTLREAAFHRGLIALPEIELDRYDLDCTSDHASDSEE